MKYKFLAALVVAALGLLPVLVAVTPAGAAAIPYTPPTRPGPGYEWGVSFATLGANDFEPVGSEGTAGGGWRGFTIQDDVINATTGGVAGTVNQPLSIRLHDPWITSTGRLALREDGQAMPDYRTDARSLRPTTVGAKSYLVCQATEWATPDTQTTRQFNFSGQTVAPTFPSKHGWTGHFKTPDLSNYATAPFYLGGSCPFLVKIVWVHAISEGTAYLNKTGSLSPAANPSPPELTSTWYASDWLAQKPYPGKPLDWEACVGAGVGEGSNMSPECAYVPGVDEALDNYGLGVNQCANGPLPQWLSFDWLIPFVQFHVRCMLTPKAPFDADGSIQEAIADTSMGGALVSMTEALAAWQFEDGCGVVIGDGGPLTGFVMDTCTWDFMASAKDFIHNMVLLLGGFFVVMSVINTTTKTLRAGEFEKVKS